MDQFKENYEALLKQALDAINNYNGNKAVALATGEKAIDFDDAWLILRGPKGPALRDKRDQRLLQKGMRDLKLVQEEDHPIVYVFEPAEIFDLADRLCGRKKKTLASYDVTFEPMVNVKIMVADPEHPTQEETDAILEAASQKLFKKTGQKENATKLELYATGEDLLPPEKKKEIDIFS